MTIDVFSTGVLGGVVQNIVPEYDYLTRTFFPGEQQEFNSAGTITLDVYKKSRRISPFVSPYVQGQIVEKQGFHTMTFAPAYIKDKRVFDANAPFTRSFGEPLMGNMSAAERMEANVRLQLMDQVDMLNRRLEVMAGEILLNGTLTIVGELYPEVELNFQRDADLRVNLSGSVEWGDTGINPLNDLEDWAEAVFNHSGVRPRRVTMTLDAYRLFKNSDAVVAILNRTRETNTLSATAIEGEDDGWSAGQIAGWDIYVYGGTYIDPITNTERDILPPMTVIVGDGRMRGYKAFGAIRDERAGWQAMKYFPKSWLEEDPAVRYIMLQSAPILAPLYPDAVLAATVKVTSGQ